MNIFTTSECPIECAEYLDDKRVIKMALESAQLLSTAILYHKNPEYFTSESTENRQKRNEVATQLGIYKATHPNHPCNVWARKTWTNWCWLFNHFHALCNEYEKRYGKKHKSLEISSSLYENAFMVLPDRDEDSQEYTDPPNCAAHSGLNIDYKHQPNTFLAYQLYLNDRWDTDKRTPTWYGVRR